MKRGIFEGIKVVEFAAIAAGPLIGMHMAQHGATSVHVESYKRPDGFRQNYPPYKDNKPGLNRSGAFTICNNDKYGITLNLKAKGSLELAKKLIAWADVVIENFTPGTLSKLGMGYEHMKPFNEDIVWISSCNQGQTGPHAFHPGFGSHLSSLCGFTYMTGYQDRYPCILYGPYVDHIGVGYGVIAAAAALEHRRKTGEGQYVDLAQYEVGVQFMTSTLLEYSVNKRIVERDGNRHTFAAPHNAYPCKGDDRWCVIAVFTDDEWKKLAQCMGREDLIADSRFATIPARKANEEVLDKEVEKWTSQLDAYAIFHLLQKNGVQAGVVQTMEDLFEHDPQLKHRGFWSVTEHPEVGKVHAEGPPFAFSKTPFEVKKPAPCIGEHNELVFKEFLGIPAAEYDRLVKEGVIA